MLALTLTVEQHLVDVVQQVMLNSEQDHLALDTLQRVQTAEQDSSEAFATLEANVNMIKSLRDFYTDFMETNQSLLSSVSPRLATRNEDVRRFDRRLKSIKSEIRRDQTRVERLIRLSADKKSLVGQHRRLMAPSFHLA
jgi:hypothetical protein